MWVHDLEISNVILESDYKDSVYPIPHSFFPLLRHMCHIAINMHKFSPLAVFNCGLLTVHLTYSPEGYFTGINLLRPGDANMRQ